MEARSLQLGLNVADTGGYFSRDDLRLPSEDRRRPCREGAEFLAPGDFNGSEKGVTAAYNELIHWDSLRKSYEEMGAEIGAETTEAASGGRLRVEEDSVSCWTEELSIRFAAVAVGRAFHHGSYGASISSCCTSWSGVRTLESWVWVSLKMARACSRR